MKCNLTLIGTCCQQLTRSTIFFQLFNRLDSLNQRIEMVTYKVTSCFVHMLHTSFLVMDMVNAVVLLFFHG